MLLFWVWHAPASRPTRDIDLLGRMDHAVEAVVPVFREVCGQLVEPDGLPFRADTVASQAIKVNADYSGVRVTLLATLQNSRMVVQVDIGLGDVLTPGAAAAAYPTLLDFPAPQLHGYNRETVIAKKFEALVIPMV